MDFSTAPLDLHWGSSGQKRILAEGRVARASFGCRFLSCNLGPVI